MFTAAQAEKAAEFAVGAVVVSTDGSTTFNGTDYDPDTCPLQFMSVDCDDDNCGFLNGYNMTCVNLGKIDGKEKKQCQCEDDKCQSQSAVNGTVPQFGDCSSSPCVDSYGYISTSGEQTICAEKIYCVTEVNTTATEPAHICHTCMSCIQQNDAADKKLSGERRFDCTSICPKEILDTIEKRNAQGVGIADTYSSKVSSSSGSATAASTTSASGTTDGSSAMRFHLSYHLAGVIAAMVIAFLH